MLSLVLLKLRWVIAAVAFAAIGCSVAAERAALPYPLWDGKESVEQYAQRVKLPPTKTLDLGGGVMLELVLIPAGKFVMGTPEPVPVDEAAFRTKIIVGQAVLALGAGILLVLIGGILFRAVRQRRRPQFSLARCVAMTFATGVGVLGGMHYWQSTVAFSKATAEYRAAQVRFRDANDIEKPAHVVTLTKPFYMGKYAVTQEQYEQMMGSNPSHFKGQRLPVEMVSWDDAQNFNKKVSEKTSETLRLPTEAEWEFACRAGTTTAFYSGDTEADLARVAWYGKNSGEKPHPVGEKAPNAFGLYDMHGNVWEWCQDGFGLYKQGQTTDPTGPADGASRVLRGGSWDVGYPDYFRCARRHFMAPVYRCIDFGFRVARTP